MRFLAAVLVAAALVLLGAFLDRNLLRQPDRVRVDTTFVHTPPRVITIDPLPVSVQDPAEIIFDYEERVRIDSVRAECADDSIKVRTYESALEDSLLSGTLRARVFGILLDQELEYSLSVPHITKTVYRSPVRGLIGGEISYREGSMSASPVIGLRHTRQTMLLRMDPFHREWGVTYLRTF